MLLSMLLPLAAYSAQERFYLGAFTAPQGQGEGIYTGVLDSETGKLGPITLAAKSNGPSFLAFSRDGKHLYSVSSDNGGSLSAFAVNKDGTLSFINSVAAGGGGATYVAVDASGSNALAASYGSGTISCIRIKSDCSLGDLTSTVKFQGTGPGPRQIAPHAHFICTDGSGKFVYVCDLGNDHVWSYHFDPDAGKFLGPTDVQGKVPPGSGARHLAFGRGEKFAYVNGEMGRNVTVFRHDASTGSLSPVQTIPVVPSATYIKTITTAETVCHPSGKWLYISSRGDDIVAVFAIAPKGRLSFVQDVPSVVKFPRGMGVDPSGRWLITAGQNDSRIAVFGIAQDTGKLTPNGEVAKAGSPVSVLFAPVD
jgi:6-phosphogluconolactonase